MLRIEQYQHARGLHTNPITGFPQTAERPPIGFSRIPLSGSMMDTVL